MDAQPIKGPKVWVDQMPYELPEIFSHKEARIVRRITGLPTGALFEDGNEIDLAYAYAFVAMLRENPQLPPAAVEAKLDALDIGKITLDGGEVEELPLAASGDAPSPSVSVPPNGSESTPSTAETLEPSGAPI